jgi:hypothetical protein
VVGIAMLPQRERSGSSATEKTGRAAVMAMPTISEGAAPVGCLSQSPQFVAPWETPDSNVTSERIALLASGESKSRGQAGSKSGGKYGATSSAGVLFSKYDVMDEGMTPLKKAVSFAGDMTFPERRPGQGQHPAIPLKRRNSTINTRMKISHF